jgi:hypothetical protein
MTGRVRTPRHNRRRAVALAIILSAVGTSLVLTGSAAAQVMPDASCPGPRDNLRGASRWAQTFRALNSGPLTSVQFEARSTGTPRDVTVEIRTFSGGDPFTGALLAQTTVPASQITPFLEPASVTATFASPAEVVAGQPYALVIREQTPEGEPTSLQVSFRTGNPCPGEFYSNGVPHPDEDMVFATFVGFPEADFVGPPKADGTLTIDANKGKVEKGRKVTLTGQLDVAANESCEQNRSIQLQRRLKSEDDSKFATFATVQTDAAGNYTLKTKVKKTRFYRAVVTETEACDDESSNSQKVRVQKKKAAQEA